MDAEPVLFELFNSLLVSFELGRTTVAIVVGIVSALLITVAYLQKWWGFMAIYVGTPIAMVAMSFILPYDTPDGYQYFFLGVGEIFVVALANYVSR